MPFLHILRGGSLAVPFLCALSAADDTESTAPLYPEVEQYIQLRVKEFDQIPVERTSQLREIARYVKRRTEQGKPARLNFICTHNSRRSQMSQIWAATAASHYRIDKVETFSGGSASTAFNPRAIAAIKRSGLTLKPDDDDLTENPRYLVRFQEAGEPLVCFSKLYNDASNPQSDFCAIMTCTQADKNCPTVKGSSLRVALPYEDPKLADDTAEESTQYDERCAQISREMLYLFSLIRD